MACAGVLAGCAQHSDEVAAQYVSPLEYSSYNCRQLENEMQSISRRAQEMGAKVDDDADSDSAEMGIGLVLFWPALFFLDGKNTAKTAEYSRLKGELEAVEKAMMKRGCR